MSFQVGERVGDYEVIQVLGAGGMGKVYKVRNVISDRVEAMKVLLPNLESDPELADRFMREIKVQARLQHPHIAALHTAQRVGNQLLMMIEFVEGETLEQLMRKGPIPLDQCIRYFQQVLTALQYAHQSGIVHRDIKPANMMLTPGGQMKLMDFGIAKLSADRKLTQTGRTVGSLFYMSPEQINGVQNLDGRSDLYSLGVSLYEAATGRRPFQGDSDYSIMAAHLQSKPVPPIELDPRLPAVLNDIILMAIAKDPAQRFQSADAFRRALESVAGAPLPVNNAAQPGAGVMSEAPPPVARPGSARTLYMAIGSVVTIVVLAVAAIQGPKWFRSSASSQTPQNLNYQLPSDPQDQPGPAAPVPNGSPDTQAGAAATAGQAPMTAGQAPATQAPVSQAPASQPAVQPTTAAPQTASQALTKPAGGKPLVTTGNVLLQQQVRPTQSAVTTAQAPAQQPAVPTQTQPTQPAAQVAPAPKPDSSAELSEARETLVLLGTRANSMIASVTRMQQQQAGSGLGMRPDVLNARQRMEFYLNEAEGALRAGDAVKAKRSLGQAEKEVEKLENFFGR